MKNMVLPDIEEELKPHLTADEELIWTGRPEAGMKFRKEDILFFPFSLIWGGFAFFWMANVIGSKGPFIFKLVGLPFLCIAIYMVIGRFIVDAKQRENTVYGLTAKRLLIKTGLFDKKIVSVNLRSVFNITLSEEDDGSGCGTIFLGEEGPARRVFISGAYVQPKIEFIENVRSVYDLIISAQNK